MTRGQIKVKKKGLIIYFIWPFPVSPLRVYRLGGMQGLYVECKQCYLIREPHRRRGPPVYGGGGGWDQNFLGRLRRDQSFSPIQRVWLMTTERPSKTTFFCNPLQMLRSSGFICRMVCFKNNSSPS